MPVIGGHHLSLAVTMEFVTHVTKKGNNYCKIVPICLNKVVAGDGGGIDMVFTEGTNKGLQI